MSLNRRVKASLVVAIGLLCLEGLAGFAARAQTPQQSSINLGGRGWGAAEAPRRRLPRIAKPETIQFSAKAGIASDYIYRGTTLSDRKPAIGAGVEATYRLALCRRHGRQRQAADPAVGRNHRKRRRASDLGQVEFDLGITYFAYPGEMPGGPTNGIEYWETAFRAVAPVGESIRVAAGYAYSPDVSNTGAWSQYAAAGFGFASAGAPASAGHRRLVHDRRRLFLVRPPSAGARRIRIARLSQLAGGRHLQPQVPQH